LQHSQLGFKSQVIPYSLIISYAAVLVDISQITYCPCYYPNTSL